MRIRGVALLIVAVTALTLVAVVPARASSPLLGVTSLPTGFADIAVDSATQRVFVSSPDSNSVTVLDLTGTVQASLSVPSAGALFVDGSTLYVASRASAGAIDRFDTASLAPLPPLGAGTLSFPGPLVKAGGLLWTTTGGCYGGGSSTRLASVDPASGTTTVQPYNGSLSYCPFLFTSPTDPNLVLGFEPGVSPTSITRLDVSSGSAVQSGWFFSNNSNSQDGAVLPDGKTFALASGSPYQIQTFSVDPLQESGVVYPSGSYPDAVAVTAANGGELAAGRDAAYDPDIDVYRLGNPSSRLLSYDFGSSSDTLKPGGLAFSPDGTRLFAVSGDFLSHSARLSVLAVGPSAEATTTTVTATPIYAEQGDSVTFTAAVSNGTGTAPPTGTVTFTEGNAVRGTVGLDANGRASLVLSDLAVGSHTLTAAYTGDREPSSGTATVVVHAFGSTTPNWVTPLPNGFGGIVVADAAQRVFVSSPGASTVTVTDLGGRSVGSLAVPGAGAMVVDGGTLYVAATTGGTIEAFDTATLASAGSFGGGSLVRPVSLVKAGGRLWTTTGSCGTSVRLVSIDPATGATATFSLRDIDRCPALFTSPTDPNLVLGFDRGGDPTIDRLDVSSGSPVVTASLYVSAGPTGDAQVLPDGQSFTLASGYPYQIDTFSVNPLQIQAAPTYVTGTYPNAVRATAGNGGLLAAGRNSSYDDDIDVFRLGDPSQRLFHHDFGSSADTLATAGLALTADGSTLYAVSGNWYYGNATRLNVFDLGHPSTTTALAISPSPAGEGQPVTFTASVSSEFAGSPTGTVSFSDGDTVLGTAPVGGGQAVLPVSSLPVGVRTVTARYGGDSLFAGSAARASVTVRALTKTALATSPNPSVWGLPVTLTATVSRSDASPVTGASVSFFDGQSLLGVATTGGTGTATLTTSALEVGARSLTATYAGSATMQPSASGAAVEQVSRAPSVTSLTSSANPATEGVPMTLTAVVVRSGPGAGLPTGAVTFRDGTTALGAVALQDGRALLTLNLARGKHDITAAYGGDVHFSPSTSASLTQVVNRRTR